MWVLVVFLGFACVVAVYYFYFRAESDTLEQPFVELPVTPLDQPGADNAELIEWSDESSKEFKRISAEPVAQKDQSAAPLPTAEQPISAGTPKGLVVEPGAVEDSGPLALTTQPPNTAEVLEKATQMPSGTRLKKDTGSSRKRSKKSGPAVQVEPEKQQIVPTTGSPNTAEVLEKATQKPSETRPKSTGSQRSSRRRKKLLDKIRGKKQLSKSQKEARRKRRKERQAKAAAGGQPERKRSAKRSSNKKQKRQRYEEMPPPPAQ